MKIKMDSYKTELVKQFHEYCLSREEKETEIQKIENGQLLCLDKYLECLIDNINSYNLEDWIAYDKMNSEYYELGNIKYELATVSGISLTNITTDLTIEILFKYNDKSEQKLILYPDKEHNHLMKSITKINQVFSVENIIDIIDKNVNVYHDGVIIYALVDSTNENWIHFRREYFVYEDLAKHK